MKLFAFHCGGEVTDMAVLDPFDPTAGRKRRYGDTEPPSSPPTTRTSGAASARHRPRGTSSRPIIDMRFDSGAETHQE